MRKKSTNILPSDILAEIRRGFKQFNIRINVITKISSLWERILNVAPEQLARAILLLSGKSEQKFNSFFASNFFEDPRNILAEVQQIYPHFDYGKTPFFELSSIQWDNSDYPIVSIGRFFISNLNIETEIWVDKEQKNQEGFNTKQQEVFEAFLNIPPQEITKMYEMLANYRLQLINKNRITKKSLQNKNGLNLYFDAILLPEQLSTTKNYIFLLPNTNWKIKRSKHIIELEVLFEDNKIVLLQEMTGLFRRSEWDYLNSPENSGFVEWYF